MSQPEPIYEVEEITMQYRASSGILMAVSDTIFKIKLGEYFRPSDKSRFRTSTVTKILGSALTDQRLSPDVGGVDTEAMTMEDDC